MVILTSLLSGLMFGAGLLISGMMQPAKVLAFLDIFGAWDPSLIVVMVAALLVAVPGFRLARRRGQPMFATTSLWPTRVALDRPLVVGAALFGIGWGLVGLCPGPAVENLATLSPPVIVFVAAMAAGMLPHEIWQRSSARARRDDALAASVDG